ncbi:MAG TPA: F0F1 ATP synthase subunit beta, partial [Caldisericia bacterium]|nr:F0F1 ATP synthase subunit beta [Caldisericia bacterium]
MLTGYIVSIEGSVVIVKFPSDLPEIFNILNVIDADDQIILPLEAQEITESNEVKCIAMGPTDGLSRGLKVIDSGSPIKIHVGDDLLGRVLDVFGKPIDGFGEFSEENMVSILPKFSELYKVEPAVQILETGIKVIDLLAPFPKGGKIGLFGGAGVGKTVLLMELMHNIATKQQGK